MHPAPPGWLRRARARSMSADVERRALLELPSAVVAWTADGRVLHANHEARALGLRLGRPLPEGPRPPRLPVGHERVTHEWRVPATGGAEPHTWGWGTVVLTARRGERVYLSVGGDITELRNTEHRLRTLATTDPLTGLPNRPALLDELTDRLADPLCTGVSVLFCDLDGFKAVNDTYGHSAGDLVLRTVASRLRRCVRDGDRVGRLGGDEFVVVCARLPDEAAHALARRLTTSVAQPVFVPGGAVTVGLSVGVATGAHGDHPAAVLDAADSSMYHVKSWRGTQRAVTATAG